jgi:mannosyltransferase
MADLEQTALPSDGIVVMPPEQVYTLAQYGDGSLPLYPLLREPGPLTQADLAYLEALAIKHQRLWLVLGDTGAADPDGLLMPWLAERFYRADDTWYGPVELLLYAPRAEPVSPPEFQETGVTWEQGISLLGYHFVETSVPLGQIVRLDLSWQASEPLAERYKVFIHLLDEGGQLVSQRDSEPLAGIRPTTSWPVGEPIADRYGLRLPADLPTGDYRLFLGLYQAETGERLTACCPAADAVLLARVHVEGGVAALLVTGGN